MMVRIIPLLALLLSGGCAGLRNGESAGVPVAGVEVHPLAVALIHFRNRGNGWFTKSSDERNRVWVDYRYAARADSFEAMNLRWELVGQGWSVPDDARLDMVRRLEARETLPVAVLPDFAHVVDFERDPPNDIWDFQERHPEVRYWVTLLPPGYSADGTQAIICFHFGPTIHGSSAIYLLERRPGGWRVVRHHVIYYA